MFTQLETQQEEADTMAKVRQTNMSSSLDDRRPALTPESREGMMIALAMDLVEQRLRDGTASSQETTHFLKLATAESKLKVRMLEEQEKLTIAKTKEIEAKKDNKELFERALKAMQRYQGVTEVNEDEDY